MRGMDFWLVTTEHLKNGLLFKDEEDYKCGMNCVAVSSVATDVNILAFILMSNHTHFVLECSETDVNEFITRFKKYYARFFCNKYKEKKLFSRNKAHIQQLNCEDETLERAIAYVQMNAVAANICLNFTQYQWGTGSIFFNNVAINGRRISDITYRKYKRILHTTQKLPDSFIIEDDYIHPISFVDVKRVEEIFKTPRRMNFFLSKSSKALKNTSTLNNMSAPTFKDSVMHGAAKDICTSMFHKNCFDDLDSIQLIEMLRQLKWRFSASADQIARVTGLEYGKVSKLLDSV